ncbi:ABC transporter permease subunit [Seonamhaeicola sp.]|uniref:ABC transporter permease subunit n=1 Tax=Seonamhaeicola sp. TaxID=1912245 RepID=UPI002603E656|nr:ABC transporter permease subunit [Seonamhaeicola sp.]
MFSYNFTYELKLLVRNKWLPMLSLLLLISFTFATYNGNYRTQKRVEQIASIESKVLEKDANMLKLLDSVEKGMEVKTSFRRIPNTPMAIGYQHPRAVTMSPNSMSAIAIGQSDIFSDAIMPITVDDDFSIDFTEMTSSVQLLFGSFDLTFVIIYLLPLLIIAFSYNILSAEKERGALRLLASQPISIYKWIFQKMILRFFWLGIIMIIALVISFLISGINLFQIQFISLTGLILVYMLFWFSLSFFINLVGGSSAKNAAYLIGLWVFFVLLVPSSINQIANSTYPTPSRNNLVNTMRTLKVAVSKKQDTVLDHFLRHHPELVAKRGSEDYGFWHKYMASMDMVAVEIDSLFSLYDEQLKGQQDYVNKWIWLSPSLVINKEMNRISGNSTADYQNFKNQALSFSRHWRNHLIFMLYSQLPFTTKDYDTLPKFTYKPLELKGIGMRIAIQFILCILIGLLGIYMFKKRLKKGHAILNN